MWGTSYMYSVHLTHSPSSHSKLVHFLSVLLMNSYCRNLNSLYAELIEIAYKILSKQPAAWGALNTILVGVVFA